jgi:hypothetical protein
MLEVIAATPVRAMERTTILPMRSRIEPMKKIACSLRQRREVILNYFRGSKADFQWGRRGLEQQG